MISRHRSCSLALAGVLALVVSSPGCGPSSTQSVSDEEPMATEDDQLAQREREIEEREAALRQREADVLDDETKPVNRERVAPARAAEVAGRASDKAAAPLAVEDTARSYGVEVPRSLALPAGTQLDLEMLSDLSSGTSVVGETFRARVLTNVMAGDAVAIPAGSAVLGSVTEVVPLKKIGGQAQIALGFDSVELASGAAVPIRASLIEAGKKQAGRDAAKIGGGAAAGAVLGHQVDEKKGKLIGAIVGGAIGAAVAANTGKEVELPAGTQVSVQLEQAIEVPAGG